MNRLRPSQVTGLLRILLATTAMVGSADAQGFGRVGAVNQQATGTPPGGDTRTLTIGASIVARERVRTSASGSTQIQFPDQSAINLGANCDLVIDQFVYNPQAKSGTMVATASRGVLRFIGGQISHNAGATIRTPSAAVGVRGGMVTVMMQRPQGTLVMAHFGQIMLQNNVSTVNLKPGYAALVGGLNSPISTPFLISDATLKLATQRISSKQGQAGGVARAPTPGIVPAGYRTTVVSDPTNPPGTDPLGYTSIFGAGNGAARGVSQTGQAGSVSVPPPAPVGD